MDLFKISINSDESDTSSEEFEIEEKFVTSEGIGEWKTDLLNLIDKLRRPVLSRYSSLYSGDEDLKFMIMDIGSAINSKIESLNTHSHKNYYPIVRLYGITEDGFSVCANIRNFGCCFYVVPQPQDISSEDIGFLLKHLNEGIISSIAHQTKSKKYDGIDPKITISIVDEPSKSRVFDLRENGKSSLLLKISCSLPNVLLCHGRCKIYIGNIGKTSRNVLQIATPEEQRTAIRKCQSEIGWRLNPQTFLSARNAEIANAMDEMCGKQWRIFQLSYIVNLFIWTAGKLLKSNAWASPINGEKYHFTVYESNINHNMRFLTNKNFPGCSWIKVQKKDFKIRKRNSGLTPQTHCQLEIDVDESALENFDSDLIPPIRTLSFDIETLRIDPENSGMPQIGQDQVIQISNVLSAYPEQPFGKVVFTVGVTDPIDGADVISFENEIDMLNAWGRFVLATDPDIMTGYNIKNFDFPFLLGRGGKIGAEKISFLGRIKKSPCLLKNFKDSPKRNSNFDLNGVKVNGRIVCDLLQLFRRHSSVKGLKLNDVAQRYLGEKKNDVSYCEFHELQNKSSATRKILAEYCLQDSLLVDRLFRIFPGRDETDFLKFYIYRARNCGTPLRHLFNKSTNYNLWIMNIRKTKNPGVKFEPITPPKVFNGNDRSPHAKKSRLNLFP